MVALDHRRRVAADGHGLDHIGVKRALREKLRLARALGRRLEYLDERLADDLAFSLRVGYALEPPQEQPGRVLILQLDLEMAAEDFPHNLRLASAQQAVVDENAGELAANGLVQQRRRDARIHAAAQAQDHLFVADLGADGLRPPGRCSCCIVQFLPQPQMPWTKLSEDLAPVRRVRHFRMKLQAEHLRGAILNGGVSRVLRDGHGFEASRQLRQLVPVRIPDLQGLRQAGEEGAAAVFDSERAFAVFALLARLDLPAEILGQELEAVANAQHRNAELEDGAVRQRRLLGIDARRAAGQDDALGLQPRRFPRAGVS